MTLILSAHRHPAADLQITPLHKVPDRPDDSPVGTQIYIDEGLRYGDRSREDRVIASSGKRARQNGIEPFDADPNSFSFWPVVCFGGFGGSGPAAGGDVCLTRDGLVFFGGVGMGGGGGVGVEGGAVVVEGGNDGEIGWWIFDVGVQHCATGNAFVAAGTTCFNGNADVTVTGAAGTDLGAGGTVLHGFYLEIGNPFS